MNKPLHVAGSFHLLMQIIMVSSTFTSAYAQEENEKKIFVLDTSVLLYDYEAVKNFEDNDVAIPITVLEELSDTFKKGNSVTNLHAREFIRYLDSISDANMLQEDTDRGGRKR